MKIFLVPILLTYLLLVSNRGFSQQDSVNLKNQALNFFLDCGYCDMDYVRDEIRFVNYVREQKEADVFLMITLQETGSGGREYTLTFYGQRKFIGMNDTLVYNSKPDDTSDNIRSGLVRTIKMGLMQYVAKTPQAALMTISYERQDNVVETPDDPWNNWVFDISLYGYTNGQESTKSMYGTGSVNANQVKEEYKLKCSAYLSYSENSYKKSDGSITRSISRSKMVDFLYVKSLGDHWSAGVSTNYWSSLYNNLENNLSFYPTLEYNLFKYSDATRRQLRMQYNLGPRYNDYIDTTVYNKTEELLYKESLGIAFSMNEKWGSASVSVSGSHYFHDFNLNNLNIWTDLNIRIFKGLSFNLYGSLSLIHDQVSLPKGDATDEEILLSQRILQTQYS